MSRRTLFVNLSVLALAISALLVLLTMVIENRALVFFPTYDRGPDDWMVQISGYGYPFAFREVTYLIDTSSAVCHWWIFALDVCVLAPFILPLLYRDARWHAA